MTTKRDIIYDRLVEAVKKGNDCPSNIDLSVSAMCSVSDVHTHLKILINEGKIRRRKIKGQYSIYVVEMNVSLKRSVPSNNLMVPQEFNDPDDKDIADAKRVIRSKGYACYQASVTGGPEGKWVVGREDRQMGRRNLLAFAKSLNNRAAA